GGLRNRRNPRLGRNDPREYPDEERHIDDDDQGQRDVADVRPHRHQNECHEAAGTEDRELAEAVAGLADERTYEDGEEPGHEINDGQDGERETDVVDDEG